MGEVYSNMLCDARKNSPANPPGLASPKYSSKFTTSMPPFCGYFTLREQIIIPPVYYGVRVITQK